MYMPQWFINISFYIWSYRITKILITKYTTLPPARVYGVRTYIVLFNQFWPII